MAYGVPYISGKDSLNNEYLASDGQRHAIPGTLLISAVGIVPDVAKTVTMDLKQEGNRLYLLGETRAELGGSHYYTIKEKVGGTVPLQGEVCSKYYGCWPYPGFWRRPY
jgi:phosphoribosylformylglycinamidine synthase